MFVSFTKLCTLLSEIYEILINIFYYNSLTKNTNSYGNTSNCNVTYSDDGMTILGTKSEDVYITNSDITLPTKYSLELTVTGFNTGWNTDICVEDIFHNNAQNGTVRKISNWGYDLTKGFGSYTIGDVLKYVYNGNERTLKIYINDVLKLSLSNINSNHKQQFKTYRGRTLTVKDLIIREL